MDRSAVLFKVNQLGDNVVFLPTVQKLVADATFDNLTLWTTPIAAPLYANLQSGLNVEPVSREVFYPAWKHPLTLLRLICKTRCPRSRFALVAEDMGNTAFLLALLSGATQRVGYRPPYLKINFSITHSISLEPTAPAPEKSWLLGSALAECAGAPPWSARPPAPDLSHLLKPTVAAFDVLIHPGASRSYQRWPLERFANLARRLSNDCRVGWIQPPDLPVPSNPGFEIIHTKTLEDLVSLINATSLFIANNSGPMHIASALGTPSLVFIGPSARAWDPYWHADRIRVLRHEKLSCISCDPPGDSILEVCTNRISPMACMEYWQVNHVEAEARAWLKKACHHGRN